MRGITKTFPGVKALSDVSLTVFLGEIHSLMGENGAGKSTLMKILRRLSGRPGWRDLHRRQTENIEGPLSAKALGVAVIYQELSLCPSLSVAENIYLGRELRHGPRSTAPQWKPRATTSSSAWRQLRPEDRGRGSVDRRAPAGRDCPRAAFEGEDPGHGRANHAAFVA